MNARKAKQARAWADVELDEALKNAKPPGKWGRRWRRLRTRLGLANRPLLSLSRAGRRRLAQALRAQRRKRQA